MIHEQQNLMFSQYSRKVQKLYLFPDMKNIYTKKEHSNERFLKWKLSLCCLNFNCNIKDLCSVNTKSVTMKPLYAHYVRFRLMFIECSINIVGNASDYYFMNDKAV